MNRASRVLLILLVIGVLASVSYTYWNYKIMHNFVIIDDTDSSEELEAGEEAEIVAVPPEQ